MEVVKEVESPSAEQGAGELSEQEAAFVAALLNETGGNATEAARLAGYSGNDATLAVQGSRLRQRPRVAAALRDAEARLRRSEATSAPEPANAPALRPQPPAPVVAPATPVADIVSTKQTSVEHEPPPIVAPDAPPAETLTNNAETAAAKRYRLITHTRAFPMGALVTADDCALAAMDLQDLLTRGALVEWDGVPVPEPEAPLAPNDATWGLPRKIGS